ncbi:MAG: hypothetical protein HC904_03900 [Blastochloris sp.]|nr:hypothetical protein [Blastochloris sp.]
METPHFFSRLALILRHGRTRRILFVLTCAFLLLILTLWLTLRQIQLTQAIAWLGQQAGQEVHVGQAQFTGLNRLELRKVQVGDFARIDFLELQWSYSGLAQSEVEQLRVHGVQLFLGKMISATSGPNSPSSRKTLPFKLKRLILGQATLFLDNLGAGLPALPVRIGEVTPLVLNNLELGGSSTDPAASVLQVVQLDDLRLYSPYDPFTPVLGFEQIRLVFSWNGIQNQLLDQLTLVKPIIYVGEDLFLFVDQVKSRSAKPDSSPMRPWTIGSFEVRNGQIVLTTFSRPGLTLPFLFSSQPQPIVLDDFSKMQFATEFKIDSTNLNYPDYGLRVKNMAGTLSFSLPPSENDATNIVPTLKADSIEWKGLTMSEAWVGMTFDRRGLFAEFGGKTYQGYTQGNAIVYLTENFPWSAPSSSPRSMSSPSPACSHPKTFSSTAPSASISKSKARAAKSANSAAKPNLTAPAS